MGPSAKTPTAQQFAARNFNTPKGLACIVTPQIASPTKQPLVSAGFQTPSHELTFRKPASRFAGVIFDCTKRNVSNEAIVANRSALNQESDFNLASPRSPLRGDAA